jgi:hypothetical protein
METPSPFDLDQALRQWRASLENLGGIQAEELEELEGHLRESISRLQTRGLAIQEAFAIATRRLGSDRQLSTEFAKANPQRLWTGRAMWMAGGVLAAFALQAVTAPIADFVMNCARCSGVNEHLAGALRLLAGGILWTGAAGSAFWILNRRSPALDRVVRACFQRPVLTGLGLFIGLQCLQYGPRYVSRFAAPVYSFFTGRHVVPDPQTTGIMATWFIWGIILTGVLWIAAGPLLAGYAWRKRGRPASETPVSPELQPGECAAARALQSQGLSLDEASLILALRRCPPEVVAPSCMLSTDRGIWLERTVWMVTGVALGECLELLAVIPGWVPAMATRPVAPLAQHLAGLGSVCLGMTLAGAVMAGLCRWITRHPGQSASVGGCCRRRPFLAATTLVAICAGIASCEFALLMYVMKLMPPRAHGGLGPIASWYLHHCGALTHCIIPIALLLWLARRWRGIQANPAPCR